MAGLIATSVHAADLPTPPVAAKTAWQETRHGEVVTDDYRWMHKKTDPAVIAHLNAENAYTEAMTASFKPLTDTLYAEMKGRIKETDLSVPTRKGDYFYYFRSEAGKQYQVYARRHANAAKAYDEKAAEEVLLDMNAMAEGHKFFAVGRMAVSPNAKLLAYTTDTTGFRQYELHVKDLASGKELVAAQPRITGLAWAADNQTLLLLQEDAVTKRSDRLLRIKLGGQPEQVLTEKDELFALSLSTTRDEKYFVLQSHATDTHEVRLLPTATPTAAFRSLGRNKGHRYEVDVRGKELYILTNKNAKNFRVVKAPLATPDEKHWTEVVPHNADVLITDIDMFQNFLVVSERSQALDRLRIYDFTSKHWQTVKFDDEVYTLRQGGTPEYTASQLRLSYQSPLTPATTLDVDMKTGKQTVLKRQEVLGGFDPSRYEAHRLWATARDGVKVPLWTIYKKGTKLDGSAPLLLYAYGSYGIPATAAFSSNRLSLIDRGVIFVQAHIRGGNDMGEHWHEDGMLMKKKNTFYDFIDSAEWLIANKYTNKDKLVIQGGSAGGLLMGAVTNMRPDLFHAVHAAVPFVDVMNTMMDASLPLTTGEYLEWGNPNEKAAYDYMKSYSPYDNIEKKAYPSMLVTTGLNDSQVMYWEPAKYVAKLRTYKTDSNPLLLKVNMGAGHGGASGRYDALKEQAFIQAWMLAQWGITQ
nr:S9 family peptidase [Massilia sp. TS11]